MDADERFIVTQKLGEFIRGKDQAGLELLFIQLVLNGMPAQLVEEISCEVMAEMPVDIQQWWADDCDCQS